MPLSTEVGRGPGDIAADEDPAPLPQKGHSPQFSAHVYCGQIAGCLRMPLGMEVGLDPGDIVLDGGTQQLPQIRGTAPNFRPISNVAKRSPISATAELLSQGSVSMLLRQGECVFVYRV